MSELYNSQLIATCDEGWRITKVSRMSNEPLPVTKTTTDGRVQWPADDVRAPWSDDQVASLNGYQACRCHHPFTCVCVARARLVAASDGWQCPAGCGRVQDWAHGFMADWSWMQTKELMNKLFCTEEDAS